MRVVLFAHSFLSDWNNSSAHFLRGVVSEDSASFTSGRGEVGERQ